MSLTIGVCILAKNEEVLIGRCLKSVAGADQVVVVDTGSTDLTCEIAEQHGAEVHKDFIWCDAFDLAQNHAKSKMKTDWILSLDCDEVLVTPIDEIRKIIERGKDMIRVTMKAEGGQRLEFGFGRLFRNSPDIYWVQPIHKHLNIPGEGEDCGNVEIVFGYSPAHNNDPDRALRILEKVVSEEKDPGRNLYYLGREYWYKQRYAEATATLGRYVQISNWPAEKAEAFLVMSQAYSAQGLDNDARDACLQCLKLNPNFKEAIEWMAGIVPPEHAMQWKRMAKTANNKDVMWDRVPADPKRNVFLLAPHPDDEVLFASFVLQRHRPHVIIITESHIQHDRGEIGCDAETRRNESIAACNLLGCTVSFLGIKDTELTEEILKDRLKGLYAETIYTPAYHANGNPHHNLVNKVVVELFKREQIEQYTSYSKTDLLIKGNYELAPTEEEVKLKDKAMYCFKSQLNLPSTRPHFDAVRGKSEWLL